MLMLKQGTTGDRTIIPRILRLVDEIVGRERQVLAAAMEAYEERKVLRRAMVQEANT